MKRDDRFVDYLFILAIVALVVLKLTGVITCSWLTLFSPLLVLLGIGFILVILSLIILFKNDKKGD